MAVTLNVGEKEKLSKTLTPWIVQKTQTGVPNGRGGYTDVVGEAAFVEAFMGLLVESRSRVDPTQWSGRGPFAVTRQVVVFEFPNDQMHLEHGDMLVEGAATGAEGDLADAKPNGRILEVRNVREYDRMVQADVILVED